MVALLNLASVQEVVLAETLLYMTTTKQIVLLCQCCVSENQLNFDAPLQALILSSMLALH